MCRQVSVGLETTIVQFPIHSKNHKEFVMESSINCSKYLDYYQAINNVEIYLANGLDGIKVENRKLAILSSMNLQLIPDSSSLAGIKALFENIALFFSESKRKQKQNDTDEKVKLLAESLKIINNIHRDLSQEISTKDEFSKLSHFAQRVARLACVTEPSFERLNRETKISKFAVLNWFNQMLGREIKKTLNVHQFNLRTQLRSKIDHVEDLEMCPEILDVRMRVWEGTQQQKIQHIEKYMRAKTDPLETREKKPLSYCEDLLDLWMFDYCQRNSEFTDPEEFNHSIARLFMYAQSIEELIELVAYTQHYKVIVLEDPFKRLREYLHPVVNQLMQLLADKKIKGKDFVATTEKIIKCFPPSKKKTFELVIFELCMQHLIGLNNDSHKHRHPVFHKIRSGQKFPWHEDNASLKKFNKYDQYIDKANRKKTAAAPSLDSATNALNQAAKWLAEVVVTNQ
jgi:hypothetical protein